MIDVTVTLTVNADGIYNKRLYQQSLVKALNSSISLNSEVKDAHIIGWKRLEEEDDIPPAWFYGMTNEDGEVYGG